MQNQKKIRSIVELGAGNLPVCIAKTQMSLSDDPSMIAAKDWVLTVSGRTFSRAGFL